MTKPPGTRLPGALLPRRNQHRDGSLDPDGVEQNLKAVERHLRRIPELRGDRPPEVELLLGQENRAGVLWGTVTAVVRDVGENFDGFVRFAKTNDPGPFGHDDPTDTAVWNQTDSTIPYEAEIELSPKHGGLIAVAVPYRTYSEPDVTRWAIKQHRFDSDWDAELTGHELTFDTDGYPLLALNGDEDVAKHYVRMAVGDDIAGATPADPTGSGDDGTLAARLGRLRFDGTGSVANKQAAMGKLVGYNVACENAAGVINPTIFGPFFQRRGDSKSIAPRVRATGVRTGSTVAFDLAIDDPSKAITAVEFRKRENGGSLSAYGTGWDRSTGAPGSDTALTRGEDVASSPGLDSQFQWRVTWTDELGVSQYIEDTVNVSRLESITKTIKVPHTLFVPATEAMAWAMGAAFVSPNVLASEQIWYGSIILPPGVVVTDWVLRGYRTSSVNDTCQMIIRKISDSGAVASTICTLTHAGTGWTDTSDSTDETVSDDHTYTADLRLKSDTSIDDARFARLEITYNAPSYDKTY